MKLNDWLTSAVIISVAGWDYLSATQVGLLILTPIVMFIIENWE